VEISDTYGDGRHVSIDVVSPLFEGQSSVKRQRMVYKVGHVWTFSQESVAHGVASCETERRVLGPGMPHKATHMPCRPSGWSFKRLCTPWTP